MIYLIAMLAASFFVSPVVLLATIIILPIVQLLWLLSDDGVQGAARYLPSMIIGRGNAAQESQRRTEAMRIVNAPFLVWLLIGNLLILPPFIAAFFYESTFMVCNAARETGHLRLRCLLDLLLVFGKPGLKVRRTCLCQGHLRTRLFYLVYYVGLLVQLGLIL